MSGSGAVDGKGIPGWVGKGMITIAVLLLLTTLVYASCSGYDSRRFVGEAIGESAPVKARVEEFHRMRGALPDASQSGRFRVDAPELKRARRIEWNASDRMLVITMAGPTYDGKRFGYVAEPGPGKVEWTCRTIDLAPKYLPAACR